MRVRPKHCLFSSISCSHSCLPLIFCQNSKDGGSPAQQVLNKLPLHFSCAWSSLVSTYWKNNKGIKNQNRSLPLQTGWGASSQAPRSPAGGDLAALEKTASQTLAARAEGIRWSRDSPDQVWAGGARGRKPEAGAAIRQP